MLNQIIQLYPVLEAASLPASICQNILGNGCTWCDRPCTLCTVLGNEWDLCGDSKRTVDVKTVGDMCMYCVSVKHV